MRAARALAWREVVRFLRQPSRIVGAFAPPLVAWLLLGAGFGSSFRVPGGGGASYVAYFFPGTVVLVVLFAAIFSTISVIEDRREGFLQAVVVSPVSPLAVAAGKIAGGTLLALAQGGVLLLLAPVLGYTPSVAALVPALLVGTGGDRLHPHGLDAMALQVEEQGAGGDGFADFGIGAGDEPGRGGCWGGAGSDHFCP